MRNNNDPLTRLLKAAASAPQDLPADVPYGLEQRILAGWHSLAAHDETSGLLPVFRWAFVCALLAIVLSIFFNYRFLSPPTPNEFSIADSVIKLSLLP